MEDQETMLHELSAKVAALESIVVEKDQQIESLQGEVKQLAAGAPVAKATRSGDQPIFKHGGAQYVFTAGKFKVDGVVYTSAEAVKDKALLAKLVDIGAGVIKAL